jgi:BirA family biotin operon repressor/biotin-[acetyl-CoA-carboxylase] ligase
MVLRPPTPAASRILTLRLGIAAAGAIEEIVPVSLALKWPNDLVVDGRKLGGILCEASLAEDRVDHVIAGIGLNLRRPDEGWPPDLAGSAIALEGAIPDEAPAAAIQVVREPAPLVARIAEHWQAVAADRRDLLSGSERNSYAARDALRGRRVTVNGRTAGVAEGITPRGALRVRGDNGWADITAGTVRTTETMAGERA